VAPNIEEVFSEEARAATLLAMERVTEREDNPPPGRLAYAALIVLAPHVAALVAAARREGEERGAAKERERVTYRDDDGEELLCPRCGGPDPEGYPRRELDS